MSMKSVLHGWDVSKLSRNKSVMMSLGVAAGVILAVIIRIALSGSGSAFAPAPAAVRVESATEVVHRHLAWADQESTVGLNPYLNEVHEFFDKARGRSRSFAIEALGWDSKWKLTTDFFTGNGDHATFLRERFEANLFSPQELEQLIERMIGSYLRRLGDIESQMLVGMETDLVALPSTGVAVEIDREALNQALRAALETSAQAAAGEFRGMIVQEVVSIVAGEILGHVAVQLATSTGILGAGAATGWQTAGAGIVLAIVIDVIIAQIYNEAFDPAGQLAGKVNENLNEMERLILEGSQQAPGMKVRLQDYSNRRNAARRQAIEQVVLTNMAL